MENRKIIVPKRLYVSCPICAKILMRGEEIKNTLIKCHNCRNTILVELYKGKIITWIDDKLQNEEEDN